MVDLLESFLFSQRGVAWWLHFYVFISTLSCYFASGWSERACKKNEWVGQGGREVSWKGKFSLSERRLVLYAWFFFTSSTLTRSQLSSILNVVKMMMTGLSGVCLMWKGPVGA